MNEKTIKTIQNLEWDLSTYLIHYEKYTRADLIDELQTIHSNILRLMADAEIMVLEIDEITHS